MARSQPLYTIDEQYARLDEDISSVTQLNTIRFHLLVACSDHGTLLQAKNRFLWLIQDTEMRTLFSSILEIPEVRLRSGISSIQQIHKKFESHYRRFESALKELRLLGIPQYALTLMTDYFYANEDPVYKLSIMATMVLLGYVKEDEINNRKE